MPYGQRDYERRRFSQRKPPPDYFSRPMQLKLLMMVFMLMLVVVLMRETRRPENWKWFWALSQEQPAPAAGEDGIETLIPLPDLREDPPGTIYGSDSATAAARHLAEAPDEAEGVQRVQREAWRGILADLDGDQRRTLDRVLRCARASTDLDSDTLQRWREVYTVLDESWNDYLQRTSAAAAQTESQLSVQQREQLQNTLAVCESAWRRGLGMALRAPLEERPWLLVERESLEGLQALFDELALSEVRDDMISRPSERTAWFRLFEKLQTSGHSRQPSTPTAATTEVSYLQLFRQSAAYRGQLVTVRGTTHLAYRVPALENDLGIKEYAVLWLMPADGADSPLVVYALDLPPGFPPVDRKENYFDEEVTCTGYFFKRWVYNARDGVRTAPLLLVHSPSWRPTTDSTAAEFPSVGNALLVVIALILVALAVSRVVYVATAKRHAATLLADRSRSRAQEFAAWPNETPSVSESLRRMAEEARRDDE